MGMRPVTATMVQAAACRGRTVGCLLRLGAPRHLERSGAFKSSVSGSVRVVTVNSRFAFGRIAFQYRRCREGASCSGRGPPIGVHTGGWGQKWRQCCCGVAAHIERAESTRAGRHLRDAVQSAYSHTPWVACQHRTAADGGHTMSGPLCRLYFSQACASNLRPTRGRPYAPARRLHGITLALALTGMYSRVHWGWIA